MRKYFIIGLFLVMSMSSYSFAAGPWGKINLKNVQQYAEQKQNLKLSGKLEGGVRIIEVKASRYKFEPDPIVVKLGERVRLIMSSADVTHGFSLPEFNVNSIIPSVKTKEVEFVADKEGSFLVYCSVYCGPGHAQMHGAFIVTK